MIETDLIMMSLCIFVPSIFAIVLLFFPKKSVEYMRWFALLGTAVTFVLSMILFIDYLGMMDQNRVIDKEGQVGRLDGKKTSLVERAQTARDAAGKNEPRSSADMLARYPWIATFNIEYFVGVDGISMPLILLTTLLFMLAMIASWTI